MYGRGQFLTVTVNPSSSLELSQELGYTVLQQMDTIGEEHWQMVTGYGKSSPNQSPERHCQVLSTTEVCGLLIDHVAILCNVIKQRQSGWCPWAIGWPKWAQPIFNSALSHSSNTILYTVLSERLQCVLGIYGVLLKCNQWYLHRKTWFVVDLTLSYILFCIVYIVTVGLLPTSQYSGDILPQPGVCCQQSGSPTHLRMEVGDPVQLGTLSSSQVSAANSISRHSGAILVINRQTRVENCLPHKTILLFIIKVLIFNLLPKSTLKVVNSNNAWVKKSNQPVSHTSQHQHVSAFRKEWCWMTKYS